MEAEKTAQKGKGSFLNSPHSHFGFMFWGCFFPNWPCVDLPCLANHYNENGFIA